MWRPVYVEGEGLFCLLCKKHGTSNPQNKLKVFNKEPCKRFRLGEFEDQCRTSQHMNAVSAEMLQRDSLFQRTLDEPRNSRRRCAVEGIHSCVLDHEKELPNHKINSHSVSPRAYMYSRFGGLRLLFTSSSPCRKDQFAVSYFSTSLIVLIQVYNWEIRHHSLVWCCGLADIFIFNNNNPATWKLRNKSLYCFLFLF